MRKSERHTYVLQTVCLRYLAKTKITKVLERHRGCVCVNVEMMYVAFMLNDTSLECVYVVNVACCLLLLLCVHLLLSLFFFFFSLSRFDTILYEWSVKCQKARKCDQIHRSIYNKRPSRFFIPKILFSSSNSFHPARFVLTILSVQPLPFRVCRSIFFFFFFSIRMGLVEFGRTKNYHIIIQRQLQGILVWHCAYDSKF